MSTVYPPPPTSTLITYIIESCALEKIHLTREDITLTLEKKQFPNPDAAGHFDAINLVINLLDSDDVPCRHKLHTTDPKQADSALYWLRDIHKKLMTPTSQYGITMSDTAIIQPEDVGNYRLNDRCIALDRFLPPAAFIRSHLHLWLKNLYELHKQYKEKLGFVGALSNQEIKDISDRIFEAHLQIQCIHPFTDGTGRTARLIENLLRLRFGLAWKTIPSSDRMKYINQIMKYEDSKKWQNILKQINGLQVAG